MVIMMFFSSSGQTLRYAGRRGQSDRVPGSHGPGFHQPALRTGDRHDFRNALLPRHARHGRRIYIAKCPAVVESDHVLSPWWLILRSDIAAYGAHFTEDGYPNK
jgi:hypothetical protein